MILRLLTAPSARLGVLQGAVLCVSLFSQVFIARHFGVGHELDRYFGVLGTALGVMGALSVATNYVLPPELVRALTRNDVEVARNAAAEHGARILAWISALASAGAICMIVAAQLGARPAGAPDAGMIIFGWLIAATSACAGMFGAINTAYRRVALPLATSALPPAALSISLVISSDVDAARMLLAMLLGTSLQCLVLALSVRHRIAWDRLRLRWSKQESARLLIAAVGAACFSSYAVVDAFLAPELGVGALTLQSLAQRLTVAFGAVLSAGAFALAPDNFGRLIENGRFKDALRLFYRTAALMVGIALVACALTPWLGGFVLRLLFEGGNFKLAGVDQLTQVVTILLIGTGAMLSSAIGFRLLYALSSGVWVAGASLVWLVLYLVLALAFVAGDLPHALAWAYAVSWWMIFAWLLVYARQQTVSRQVTSGLQENT